MIDDPATAAPADGAPAPHASDDIPVEVTRPEPLVVAREPVAEAASAPAADAAAPASPDGAADTGKKPSRLPEWAEKKLAESSFAEREAKREAKRLTDELAAERAKRADPATPTAPNAADAAAVTAGAPAGGYKTQADFDAAVAAEASRRAQETARAAEQTKFDTKSNETYAKGKGAFGDEFDTAANNLRSVGAMTPELLEIVFATDDPAKVLYDLGSDPDKAAAIIAMTPAVRAMEIAKIAITVPPKGKPTPLSNAPRPVPPVDGSARISNEPSDNDDDDTFFKKREAQLAARRSA